MVRLRTLSADEVASVFPRRGQVDLSEYIDALHQFEPGDAAEIDLNGLSRRALKRRVGQAAKQLGITLRWARLYEDEENTLIFQVRASRTPSNGKTTRSRRTLVKA